MKPFILSIVSLFISISSFAQPHTITVGSKAFTESVILGEMATHLINSTDISAFHRRELGGSRVLWNALLNGDIDLYGDYSGTIAHELLNNPDLTTEKALQDALINYGIEMTNPLGFNNTYAIAMNKQHAEDLQITKISELTKFPNLRFGFSNEFMDRQDGWPNFQAHYQLPQTNVNGLQHDLAYQGLEAQSIDAIDVYSTDAKIALYDLHILEDDRNYFPAYDAVFLYRADLKTQHPNVVSTLKKLEGNINEEQMIQLNSQVENQRLSENQVAAEFIQSTFQIQTTTFQQSIQYQIWQRTQEHLFLVAVSLSAAIAIAIPLGILSAKLMMFRQLILGTVGIIQTIPALALLVLMIPFLGIGTMPAIAALFLYSLLPIVRNTFSGLQDIPTSIRESAQVLGLPAMTILWKIEIPLALRSILAGIKTSAVLNIGFATLGALIGAGGYGQPILTGIRLDDIGLICQGAIPAALLAIVVQLCFEFIERWVIPQGIQFDH